ncbi:MAG: hypothetical protein Q9160_004178 [Pyrenula sp. 1 TL-2023]
MNVPGEKGIQQEILVPALEAAARRDEQILSLKQHLRNKDHVISRLLDKIDSSGIDLSMVFPGLTTARSSKKRIDAEQAEKSVAGLAAFNESEWEETQNQKNSSDASTIVGLLEAIRDLNPLPLPGQTEQGATSRRTGPGKEKSPPLKPSESTAEAEDDFTALREKPEIDAGTGTGEATGISLDKGNNRPSVYQIPQRKSRSPSDASTETGSESEAEAEKLDQQTAASSKPQEHDNTIPRMTKKKTKASTKSSASSSDGEPASSKDRKQKPTSIHGSSSTSTASDSDFATSPKQPSSKPPSRRLGGIGARDPAPSTTRSKSPDVPPSAAPPSHPSTPSRKLGAIGSKKLPIRSTASPSSPTAPSSATKRSRSAHSPSPSPERKSRAKGKTRLSKAETKDETEDQKIERKRTEMKKIEEGPVKKKGRKF